MNDVLSQVSFLRTSRNFPPEAKQLSIEVDRSYIDIARNVNNRVIGFFTINRSTVTGENWFITQARRQQGLRQVYRFQDSDFTAGVATISHGIQFRSLTNFIRIWGTFFDGTNWQTLPYVDVVNVTNQINVKVNSTDIVITKGAGAPPAVQNGLIVVEWLANP
jgi:hypothetical protein